MTSKLEQKLNQLMNNWWHGNLADARQQLRALKKRELAHLLIDQQQLEYGVWSNESKSKLQEWVTRVLDT